MKVLGALGWVGLIGAGIWAISRGSEYSASDKLGFRVLDFDFRLPPAMGLMANLRNLNSLAGFVQVEVSNPTRTSIRIDAIYGDLRLNNRRIGRVQSTSPITMAAGATSRFSVSAMLYGGSLVLALPGIIAQLIAAQSTQKPVVLKVMFDGVMRIAGATIPYDQEAAMTIFTPEKTEK